MPGPWPGIRVAVGDSIYARLTDDIVDNFDNVKLRICAQTLLQPLDETMSTTSECQRHRYRASHRPSRPLNVNALTWLALQIGTIII
jgi:hypothetical protein